MIKLKLAGKNYQVVIGGEAKTYGKMSVAVRVANRLSLSTGLKVEMSGGFKKKMKEE